VGDLNVITPEVYTALPVNVNSGLRGTLCGVEARTGDNAGVRASGLSQLEREWKLDREWKVVEWYRIPSFPRRRESRQR